MAISDYSRSAARTSLQVLHGAILDFLTTNLDPSQDAKSLQNLKDWYLGETVSKELASHSKHTKEMYKSLARGDISGATRSAERARLSVNCLRNGSSTSSSTSRSSDASSASRGPKPFVHQYNRYHTKHGDIFSKFAFPDNISINTSQGRVPISFKGYAARDLTGNHMYYQVSPNTDDVSETFTRKVKVASHNDIFEDFSQASQNVPTFASKPPGPASVPMQRSQASQVHPTGSAESRNAETPARARQASSVPATPPSAYSPVKLPSMRPPPPGTDTVNNRTAKDGQPASQTPSVVNSTPSIQSLQSVSSAIPQAMFWNPYDGRLYGLASDTHLSNVSGPYSVPGYHSHSHFATLPLSDY